MKRILFALAISLATLGTSALLTKAVWTDTVTVTNNIVTTGTVDLDVSTNMGANWNDSTAASTMVLADLVPGAAATEAYSFSLLNSSTGLTTLTLTGQVTASAIVPTPGVDKTQLMLQLYDTATMAAESAEVSLAAWEAGTQSLTSTLASTVTRHYGVRARLLATALNEWQGQTVTFTLSVTGSQP